jgi:hypothetical protein
MIFGVADIISFVSRTATLEPGDLILTGTPAGVGVFRKPPVGLKEGDEISVEIERIGTLTIACGHCRNPGTAVALTEEASRHGRSLMPRAGTGDVVVRS